MVSASGRLQDHLENNGWAELATSLRTLIFDEADQVGFPAAPVVGVSARLLIARRRHARRGEVSCGAHTVLAGVSPASAGELEQIGRRLSAALCRTRRTVRPHSLPTPSLAADEKHRLHTDP